MRHMSFPPLEKGGEGGFISGGELTTAGKNPPRPPFFDRRKSPWDKGGSVGSFAEVKHVRCP